MIVVVGVPGIAPGPPARVAGLAGRIAVEAAAADARVELVGKAGDDELGEALMLALAQAGVGHVALLRDAAHATRTVEPDDDGAATAEDAVLAPEAPIVAPPLGDGPSLEPADVALALRYVPDYRVVVVADPDPALHPAAAEAAAWAQAALIVVGRPSPALPPSAIVLDPAGAAETDAFAAFVGQYAAALDRGEDPASALEAVTTRQGWERPAD